MSASGLCVGARRRLLDPESFATRGKVEHRRRGEYLLRFSDREIANILDALEAAAKMAGREDSYLLMRAAVIAAETVRERAMEAGW